MLNFGVRSTRCSSSTTTVRPADESKNGDRKIIRSSVAAVNELGTVPHSTEERWTGVGAKHTLQIHLPRKILYIISSPEICQINSMNRTSKLERFPKNLTCILQWIFGTEIDIWPRPTISDRQKRPQRFIFVSKMDNFEWKMVNFQNLNLIFQKIDLNFVFTKIAESRKLQVPGISRAVQVGQL